MTCLPPGSSTQMPDTYQTKGSPGTGRIVPTPARGAPEMPRGLFGPQVSSRHPKACVCVGGGGWMSVMEMQVVAPGLV